MSTQETQQEMENEIEENGICTDISLTNDFNDNLQITLNGIDVLYRKDGYFNGTYICKAGDKLFKDWYRLETTKSLIEELRRDLNSDGRILPSELIEVRKGKTSKYQQGTWLHPDLAIQLDVSLEDFNFFL